MPYWSSNKVGAADAPRKNKKKAKGITMEDLKAQTAARLAQEQKNRPFYYFGWQKNSNVPQPEYFPPSFEDAATSSSGSVPELETSSTMESRVPPVETDHTRQSKLPHGLTVQELKEMTKARLQAEATRNNQTFEPREPEPSWNPRSRASTFSAARTFLSIHEDAPVHRTDVPTIPAMPDHAFPPMGNRARTASTPAFSRTAEEFSIAGGGVLGLEHHSAFEESPALFHSAPTIFGTPLDAATASLDDNRHRASTWSSPTDNRLWENEISDETLNFILNLANDPK